MRRRPHLGCRACSRFTPLVRRRSARGWARASLLVRAEGGSDGGGGDDGDAEGEREYERFRTPGPLRGPYETPVVRHAARLTAVGRGVIVRRLRPPRRLTTPPTARHSGRASVSGAPALAEAARTAAAALASVRPASLRGGRAPHSCLCRCLCAGGGGGGRAPAPSHIGDVDMMRIRDAERAIALEEATGASSCCAFCGAWKPHAVHVQRAATSATRRAAWCRMTISLRSRPPRRCARKSSPMAASVARRRRRPRQRPRVAARRRPAAPWARGRPAPPSSRPRWASCAWTSRRCPWDADRAGRSCLCRWRRSRVRGRAPPCARRDSRLD